MMHLKNIRAQKAKTPEQLELTKRFNVIWLFSEDGKNWYDELKRLSPDTLKIAYNSDGVIHYVAKDASAINPDGLSVVELPATTANRRADISGRWGFDGENVTDLMTVEKARRVKRDEINRWRDNQEGSSAVFEWNGHRWDASKASQERLSSILVLTRSANLPAGFYWTDADNNDVSVTPDDLVSINENMTATMVAQSWKIHERLRDMKKEVDGLIRVNEILNYKVGWPDDNL